MTVDLTTLGNLAGALQARAKPARNVTGSWYRIENSAAKAEMWIYDSIGEFGVGASDFVNDLRALGNQPVDLHVNSEGGQVWDGIGIYTALKQHPAHVTAYVDSLAASAASFIVMAADTVVMAKQARLFVHEAQGLVVGNAKDMRDTAAVLDDLSENIASIYDDRAGGGVKKWRKAMNAETWYSAEAAVREGLADSIDRPPSAAPENSITSTTETTARWDPQQFANLMKGVFE